MNKVIQVDQSPLGNSPSSNPATYTGLFDHIRQAFAETPDAAERRLTARQFSFNVAGGRCDTCEGTGQLRIEMHFLPDVWVTCEECEGKRYSDEILEVQLHGKTIAEVLEMSCGDALELFNQHPKISSILQTLCDVGLDYVNLGQSAPTLSGGEAQRVKLAAELSRPGTGSTLYLLDEPTTGLHFDDIQKLLDVLQRLVDLGNTFVLIEHNLDVIKTADWLIDMGPEAGSEGGQIVFAGTPESLAAKGTKRQKQDAGSQTAPFLAKALRAASMSGKTESAKGSSKTKLDKTTNKSTSTANNPRTKLRVASSKTTQKKPTKKSGTGRKLPSESISSERLGAGKSTKSFGESSKGVSQAKQAATFEPWRALGIKWHFLTKGFAQNQKPTWSFEVLENLLNELEKFVARESVICENSHSLSVHFNGLETEEHESKIPWLTIETKHPDSLKLFLLDCVDKLEPDLITKQKIPCQVVKAKTPYSDDSFDAIQISLSEAKQLRSRYLKSLLKSHHSIRQSTVD